MKSVEERTCSPIAHLVHKSLHLCLPSAAPYDTESALETFAGENVLPIANALHWFWFSRYGKVGDWKIKFRFATNSHNAIEQHVTHLTSSFAHGADGCGDYDYVGDLGGDRFLGQDARNRSRTARADLVYDFLTSSARLFLASIVREADGRWRHEQETKSTMNRQTSLESVHHLFCNLTGTPTWAAVLHFPHQGGKQLVVSDMQARQIMKHDPQVKLVDLPRIEH
ncbi:MAG: hypothetical protein HY298_00690 [Verrucomicrobia bacterium]|nr:hypothetical protein [Verrucomicrobiota bacterium]